MRDSLRIITNDAAEMAGVEPTNANSESDNPVLEEFLKKRRAKRFLLIILVVFALAFLIFITPFKKGEIQQTYKAYTTRSTARPPLFLSLTYPSPSFKQFPPITSHTCRYSRHTRDSAALLQGYAVAFSTLARQETRSQAC